MTGPEPGSGAEAGLPRWTIGDVSRMSRLTVTALRHYHDEGLLVPDRVDRVTGYRYYGDGQVTEALRLGLLRQLGVPLAELRRLAAGRLTLDELLVAARRRLLAEMGERRRSLELLDALVASAGVASTATATATATVAPAVIERVLEPCVVDSLCVETGWDRLAEATRHGLARLAVAQRRAGGPVGDQPGALFPLVPIDRFGLRVFRRSGSGSPPGTERFTLPGGPMLETVHVGGHALLPHIYRMLLAEAARRGLEATGPVREVYQPPRGGSSPDGRPVTQLLVPISRPAP
jgi:DNA-binding transcriptional MerR regulator